MKEARNTLVKRIIGPAIIGRTVVDLSNLAPGDVTGLAIWNLPYAYIGIRKENNGTQTPIMVNQGVVIEVGEPIQSSQIYLKVITNDQSFASFYYSINDTEPYIKLGNELLMILSGATYLGSRFGLFCYHVGNGTSGYADFDYLHI